jgi:hypothetical protein
MDWYHLLSQALQMGPDVIGEGCRTPEPREKIFYSIKTEKGRELYTIRLSKKHRADVYRQNDFMTFVLIHPEHDSGYKTS